MRVAPSEIEDERLMPSSSESPRHRVAFQPLKAPAEVRLDPAVDVLQAVGQPPGAISQPAPDETTRRFRWPIAGARYDSIDTAGAMPSFLARRANLRSSNVAMLSQAL